LITSRLYCIITGDLVVGQILPLEVGGHIHLKPLSLDTAMHFPPARQGFGTQAL